MNKDKNSGHHVTLPSADHGKGLMMLKSTIYLRTMILLLAIFMIATSQCVADDPFKNVIFRDFTKYDFRTGIVEDGIFTGGSFQTTTATISIITGPNIPSIEQISSEDWDRGKHHAHQPIFFLWPDGTIFWSEDKVTGNGRYMTGKISPFEIPLFFQRPDVSSIVRGEPYPFAYAYFKMPRTLFTIIENPQIVFSMMSNHELEEAWRPDEVRLSTGPQKIIPPMTKEDYLLNDSKMFQSFRADWDILKAAALDLIPLATDLKEVPRDEVRFGFVFGVYE